MISAPSGTGKSILVERLEREFPYDIEESCSLTTRHPRSGEIEGKHYYFVTLESFLAKVKENAFLEHVEVFGNHYGTLKESVERIRSSRKHVILVIDTQGALEIQKSMKEGVYIFISPPSLTELEKRLISRATEDKEIIKKRLACVEAEMQALSFYDYHIINDDLEVAYQTLKSICIAEAHRIVHHTNKGVK